MSIKTGKSKLDLYMRPRISINGFVRPSIGRLVGDAFNKNKENHHL